MSKVDKIINSFLGLAIIVLILSLGILIHSNSSPQYTKKSNNREMVSSTNSKSSKKQDHQVDEEINNDSSSASSTNEVEEAGSAISSNKNTDRKNHGEVSGSQHSHNTTRGETTYISSKYRTNTKFTWLLITRLLPCP